MAFKIADFKKTTRRKDNKRYVYPYQIRDDRYTASISYAIAYYERMVGRRRADFEVETLLEFFGDPRLARGLVACLARTYSWQPQSFDDTFGAETTDALRHAKVAKPADLRAKLYGIANGRYGGCVLPHERTDALTVLCDNLPISPKQYEQGLTLDAEDQYVLVKQGPMPEPHDIIARYNYHSLETALCHAETIKLRLNGPVWNILRSTHNLARRYRLRYSIDGAPYTLFDDHLDLVLHGSRDALGNWTRTGRRLVRLLLRLLATHPASLIEGEALVHPGKQTATLRLDSRALNVLGVAAQHMLFDSEPWEQDVVESFQRSWGCAFVKRQTAGWRLRRDPEPLVGEGVIVVPDFVVRRGTQFVLLCFAMGRTAAEALFRDLAQLQYRMPVIAVMPAHVAEVLRRCPIPVATYVDKPFEAIESIATLLQGRYPHAQTVARLTPWQRLEQLVADEGFVSEAVIAEILCCPPHEVAPTMERWGGASLHYLTGLGVCAPDTVDDIRHMLEQGIITQQAA